MEGERDDLEDYMLERVDLMLGNGNHRTRDTWEKRRSSIEEKNTLHEEYGLVTSVLMSREAEVGSRVKSIAGTSAYRIEGKSLVGLQVNCRSVYNKELELWDLVEEGKTNLMSLAILFHFLCAQHVSDINISIIRSLRLCC